jgi:hypothetical protein
VFDASRKPDHWGQTQTGEGQMNRIGRRVIMVMLLIVALLIQVSGALWDSPANRLETAPPKSENVALLLPCPPPSMTRSSIISVRLLRSLRSMR